MSSRRSYDHAIRDFIDWYCSEPRLSFNRTVVTPYRIALEQRRYAPATINLRLAAVLRPAFDSGLLSPDLAAGIREVEGLSASALGSAIGFPPSKQEACCFAVRPSASGVAEPGGPGHAHRLWSTPGRGCDHCRRRLRAPGGSLDAGESHWQGRAHADVPIPGWVNSAVDAWTNSAGIQSGVLFRPVGKTGKVRSSGFTSKVIWSIVRKAAADCGFEIVAPHDLRRTCSRLCQ